MPTMLFLRTKWKWREGIPRRRSEIQTSTKCELRVTGRRQSLLKVPIGSSSSQWVKMLRCLWLHLNLGTRTPNTIPASFLLNLCWFKAICALITMRSPYSSMTGSILPAPKLDYHKMLPLGPGRDISRVNFKHWSSEPLSSAIHKPSAPPGLAPSQGTQQAGRQAGGRAASPAPLSHLGLNISSAVWELLWHERGINTGLTIASGTGRSWTPAALESIAKINML